MESTPNTQQEIVVRQSYTARQLFEQIQSGVNADIEKNMITIPKGIDSRPYFWDGQQATDYTWQLLAERQVVHRLASHAKNAPSLERLQICTNALTIALANADDGERYKQDGMKVSTFPRNLGLESRSIWQTMCHAFISVPFKEVSELEPLLKSYTALFCPDNPSPAQNNIATSFRFNAKALYTDIPTQHLMQEKAKLLLLSRMTDRGTLPEDIWGVWGISNFSVATSSLLTEAVHERFVVQGKDSLHLGPNSQDITLRMYCTELLRKASQDVYREPTNIALINGKLGIAGHPEHMVSLNDVIGLANAFTKMLNNKAGGLPDHQGVKQEHPLLSTENYMDLGEAMRRLLFMTRTPKYDKQGMRTKEDMRHVDIITKICQQRQKIVGQKVGRIATS